MSQKTALVTGAARGIGAAITAAFEVAGVTVLAPRRAEMDLARPESVREYLAEYGSRVDILVNNAGINHLAELEAIDLAVWNEMVAVNLTAPVQLLQGCTGGMKERGWGRVVNIASIFGVVTRERRGMYSTVKAGLNGLTRTAALELAPYNILVNSVCPGYVETELTRQNNSPADLEKIATTIPLGRLAQPEEMAQFVVWLCSESNTYLTGQTLLVDGGFTLR